MNTHTFSIGQMIKAGWHTFKTHWKFIWLAGFLTLIIEVALRLIQNSANSDVGHHAFLSILAFIFVFLIGIIVTIGWSKVLLGFIRSHTVTWSTFKTDPRVWLQFIKVTLWYILYVIVYAVIASIPAFIMIIIGNATHSQPVLAIGGVLLAIAILVSLIYLALKYQFISYTVLDYPELSSRNVFRKAGSLTKGSLWKLLGFAIVLGLFNLLGLICIVIGLAFTIPTTKIAQAKVYEYLKEKHN